ncbi:MAG TPA: S9 family peptidase [Usitatibacter sp.]|jgi:dipeptidyl aminopeptidase/acylaminoacyl peptidase|nr:S9 family peptidase [Usitatibacter sp.]
MKANRMTVERLWRLARPAQPTASPDGAQACVSVTTFDMEQNTAASSLWLLSAFGGEPRRLTSSGDKDAEPRWSPDGRAIAFVARRPAVGDLKADEEPQVYVIAPDGGEARRVTRMPTGAFGIRWFPDSRRIAFISWVWPDARPGALEKRYRAWKDAKVKAHVVEEPAYRWWDRWITDGRVPRLFTVDVESGRITDLFADSGSELTRAEPDASLYDIAPDGREIAFTFDPAREKRFDHPTRIGLIDLRTRRVRDITSRSPLLHETPCYSPDGRFIALVTQDQRRSPVAMHRLALIERSSGRLDVVGARWDRAVHAPLAWTRDSSAVLYAGEDRARTHLWRWDVGSRKPRVIVNGGTISDFALAGEGVVLVRNDMSRPPAVFFATKGSPERRIDRFNDDVMDGVKMGEVREIEFPGWNREPVQAWVIYPPDFDPKKRWPLLHNIHGGPHAAWGDHFHFRWNNQLFAAQGYVVVCVNFHGSSSFGQRWLQSIEREFGKRELADVEAATDFMLRSRYIDRERLFAAGGSYGGYMVAWMNGHSDRYKAYVCHAGCFDWVSMFGGDAWYWFPKEIGGWYWDRPQRVEAQNPRSRVARMKTPTLVMHGLLDYRVPDTQGLAYYNTLKAKDIPARLVFFPDENHWILKPQNSRLWYGEFFAWLARFDPARRARARAPSRRKRGG